MLDIYFYFCNESNCDSIFREVLLASSSMLPLVTLHNYILRLFLTVDFVLHLMVFLGWDYFRKNFIFQAFSVLHYYIIFLNAFQGYIRKIELCSYTFIRQNKELILFSGNTFLDSRDSRLLRTYHSILTLFLLEKKICHKLMCFSKFLLDMFGQNLWTGNSIQWIPQ